TSSSITVFSSGTFSVTQTVNGCTSAAGSNTAAPGSTPPAPSVSVGNNSGSSTLRASGYTGSLLWSTGETTPSITVSIAGTYTVTQTVGGCQSPAGSGTAAPIATLAAPLVGTVTQPSCTTPTGSVALSGLPSSGTWTLTCLPDNLTMTGTGTTATFNGIHPGTHN